MAVNKLIQDEDEFSKALDEIASAQTSTKKDKFTKKFAFVAFNEFYKSNTGLDDLPATKDDLRTIRCTLKMMGIKEDCIYEQVDVGNNQITEDFERLSQRIIPRVK